MTETAATATRVDPSFVEEMERKYLRTNTDTMAGTNALFVWNLVRVEAGLPRLSKQDLFQRTIDMYRGDAARAEDRGDRERADRYTDIARRLAAEFTEQYGTAPQPFHG